MSGHLDRVELDAGPGAGRRVSPWRVTGRNYGVSFRRWKGRLTRLSLFADLNGSMELLADRDPEEARKILDPVLERMMEAIHRYALPASGPMAVRSAAPYPKVAP